MLCRVSEGIRQARATLLTALIFKPFVTNTLGSIDHYRCLKQKITK